MVLRAAFSILLLTAIGCGGGATGSSPAPSSEPVASSAPTFPRPFAPELRSAVRALEGQRLEEGRTLVHAYLDAHPADALAVLLLGMSHYWTQNYGAARPWLEKALELEPDLDGAREALAYSLLLLGELDGARREYGTYVARVPGDPKGHYGLGLIELEETHLDAAAERFRHAIELFDALGKSEPQALEARQGEYGECHARLGEVHFALGEYGSARDELVHATAIAPGNISAFYTLGLVYRRLGEDALADEAAERYESAREKLLAQQDARQR